MDVDSSTRILVVHSNLDQARDVVQRKCSAALQGLSDITCHVGIRALANDTTELPAVDSDGSQPLIPWTISNKYYTADIHFKLINYGALSSSAPNNTPAVIYVWERGTVRVLPFDLTT